MTRTSPMRRVRNMHRTRHQVHRGRMPSMPRISPKRHGGRVYPHPRRYYFQRRRMSPKGRLQLLPDRPTIRPPPQDYCAAPRSPRAYHPLAPSGRRTEPPPDGPNARSFEPTMPWQRLPRQLTPLHLLLHFGYSTTPPPPRQFGPIPPVANYPYPRISI